MAEGLPRPERDAACRVVLDIPWLRRWDRSAVPNRPKIVEDLETRLFNIEYMNMLEELEFH